MKKKKSTFKKKSLKKKNPPPPSDTKSICEESIEKVSEYGLKNTFQIQKLLKKYGLAIQKVSKSIEKYPKVS